MTFDIVDAINEATKESDAFEDHPAKALGLEERLLYLQGLSLVMNADGDIDTEGTEYLRIIIKSFDMDGSSLAGFVSFAQKPDRDTIQAFFRAFRRKPIAQLFLFDAWMMTRRDGSVSDKEIAVVNKMADQMEILKGTQQDIHDLFCHITTRNWQKGSLYFDPSLIDSDHFKHLLAYHEIDYDGLMTEIAEIRRNRIITVLQSRLQFDDLVWEPLCYDGEKVEGVEITSDFISLALSHDVLVPFLQARLDRGELRVSNGKIYKNSNEEVEECECGNITDLALDFNQESQSLLVNPQYKKGTRLPLLADIQMDYFALLLKGLDFDMPESINRVLEWLFSCQIAYGKEHSAWGKGCFFFPFSKGVDVFLRDEIILTSNGTFCINPDGESSSCSDEIAAKMTVQEVLLSGRFRLVRKVKLLSYSGVLLVSDRLVRKVRKSTYSELLDELKRFVRKVGISSFSGLRMVVYSLVRKIKARLKQE